MKNSAKRLSALVFGLMLIAAGHAVFAEEGDGNPYQPIIGRNVFGLKAPPPPPKPEDTRQPPPKITLQGITTILGRQQVLFKVQLPPKPPLPPKDESLVMNVGQRYGEIEVLEIDAKAETIKFRNYGVEQTLSMKDDSAKPVVTSPPMPGAMAPGIPSVMPQQPTAKRTIPTRTLRLPAGAGPAAPIPPAPPMLPTPNPHSSVPAQHQSTPEEEAAALVQQRLYENQQGGQGVPQIPGQ